LTLALKNILAEGELAEAATVKDYLIVRSGGALGKVHQLFGDELNVIIAQLNESLAA
jgi:hypothetical protein